MQKHSGFTLVELVVVMSILAILGTISFLTFTSYISDSRDSKRIVDLESISSALQIRYKRSGAVYPKPSSSVVVSYTDLNHVSQPFALLGYVKSDLNLDFDDVPTDPSTNDYYIYATTVDNKFFELAATLESSEKTKQDTSFVMEQTYADVNDDYAYILWNYHYDPSIGHYLQHLVVLQTQPTGEKKIPRTDINIGNVSESGSGITTSSGVTVITNGGTDVPYPIKSKRYASSSADTGSTDFYLEATGTNVTCDNCQ